MILPDPLHEDKMDYENENGRYEGKQKLFFESYRHTDHPTTEEPRYERDRSASPRAAKRDDDYPDKRDDGYRSGRDRSASPNGRVSSRYVRILVLMSIA